MDKAHISKKTPADSNSDNLQSKPIVKNHKQFESRTDHVQLCRPQTAHSETHVQRSVCEVASDEEHAANPSLPDP